MIISSIGIVSSLSEGQVSKPGLFLGSALVAGGGLFMTIIGAKNFNKAVNLFQKEGTERRVFFKPSFNKDLMGNHIGLNIRF